MGHAARTHAPVDHTCSASPHCALSGGFGRRFHLPLGTTIYAVHLGPIAASVTPFVAHPLALAPDRQPLRTQVDVITGEMPTAAPHRGHLGSHVDYAVVTARPDDALSPLLLRVDGLGLVWVLEAQAWKRPDGPSVLWRAPADGDHAEMVWRFAGGPSAHDEAELARCSDLLLNRGGRPGRPSGMHDDSWRQLAEQAERIKAEHPSRSYGAIARSLHVDERTLRLYRQRCRAKHTNADAHITSLIWGG